MTDHPKPPPLPRLRDRLKPLRHRSSQLFTSSVAIFVVAAAVLYILVDLAGVNIPRYYPTLRTFSFDPIEGVISMGFYGRLLYALVGALGITLVHIVLRPIFKQTKLIKTGYLTVLASTALWFAAAIIVVEEWHEWGITKRELDTALPVNDEFYLWVVGTIIFFGGVLLTAFAAKRVASLNPAKGRTVSKNGLPTRNGLQR